MTQSLDHGAKNVTALVDIFHQQDFHNYVPLITTQSEQSRRPLPEGEGGSPRSVDFETFIVMCSQCCAKQNRLIEMNWVLSNVRHDDWKMRSARARKITDQADNCGGFQRLCQISIETCGRETRFIFFTAVGGKGGGGGFLQPRPRPLHPQAALSRQPPLSGGYAIPLP